MKKNFMMRAASVLLVAVMLTTCAISGTFAKYVTADDASDSARVAKWGVTVSATGTLFGKAYFAADNNTPDNDGTGTAATLTVQSENTDNVVAPGTKNEEGITAVVAGKPEVDVRVVVEVKGLAADKSTEAETVSDIFLAAGTYVDYTDGDAFNATDKPEFNLNSIYYPVKFTLTQTKNGTTETLVDGGQLSAVEEKLEGLTKTYDAGTNLANEVGTLNLTWTWDYGTAANVEADPWVLNIEDTDRADTFLGNLMAGTVTTDAANYNLETGLEISILVEQID